MQRNPHSYQIATGYRTFYSLSLIYQPITKKRLFFLDKLADKLKEKGLLLPENKWFTNLCSVGNVGSASIFIMLSELFHSSKLKKGELIYLFIPESGRFSYTTVLLKVECV